MVLGHEAADPPGLEDEGAAAVEEAERSKAVVLYSIHV